MEGNLRNLVLGATLTASLAACSNNAQNRDPLCNSEAARVNANVAKTIAAQSAPGVENVLIYMGGYDKSKYDKEFMKCFVEEVARLMQNQYVVSFNDAGADWSYVIKSKNVPKLPSEK